MEIDRDLDNVMKIKNSIIERLLAEHVKLNGHKKLRLFSIHGLEFLDHDLFSTLKKKDYLFFSLGNCLIIPLKKNKLGEEYDFSVCMEFLEMKEKLG
jgi:hypothetical protein